MQKSEAYDLILKPVLTEKSTAEQERRNVYRFLVAGGVNRIEIAQAVEMLFEVKVDKVNTMVRPGKMRRRGASYFQSPATKIALVKLKDGEKIDIL
ncbi:MAG: 50S ribosomal protein L23 [Planctomycetota bacterium]|nr:50S ribosomal protein L23 [Planctomycetota bacterium]MDA1112825.1 50S ribosomal protein L23 [Planctomycetota bacterium]